MKYSVKIATVSAILIFSFYAGAIQTNRLSAFARNETSVDDRTATNSEQREQREQQTTFSQEDSDKSNRIAEREKMAGSLNRESSQSDSVNPSDQSQQTSDEDSRNNHHDSVVQTSSPSDQSIVTPMNTRSNPGSSPTDGSLAQESVNEGGQEKLQQEPESETSQSDSGQVASDVRTVPQGSDSNRNVRASPAYKTILGIALEGVKVSTDKLIESIPKAVGERIDAVLAAGQNPELRALGNAKWLTFITTQAKPVADAVRLVQVGAAIQPAPNCLPGDPSCTPPPPTQEPANCNPLITGNCFSDSGNSPCSPAVVSGAICTSGEVTCTQTPLKHAISCSAKYSVFYTAR